MENAFSLMLMVTTHEIVGINYLVVIMVTIPNRKTTSTKEIDNSKTEFGP